MAAIHCAYRIFHKRAKVKRGIDGFFTGTGKGIYEGKRRRTG
jgi:hypothetical protein